MTSSNDPTETPTRALLAVGTASYDSPDFPALPKVPESLKRVVDTLTGQGYVSISGSRGYSINPGLRSLRSMVREAVQAAPIVVVYYAGHAVIPERMPYYLVTQK